MKNGERVSYQTSPGEYGIGIVTEIDVETEEVVVVDEDDGTVWRGPVDKTVTEKACREATTH
jgi:hypothetical protein